MKKFILLTIIISVLVLSLVQASNSGTRPDISVSVYSQSPDPVEPGEIIKIKFKIENDGKETSQDAIIKILPKFPLTIYNDEAEKNIGKLRASSTGGDAQIVEFKLKVDEQAVEGEAEIELQVKTGEGAVSYVNDELTIDVRTQDAVLDITSISADPKQISPGETSKVTIMVKNLADSLLKDIKFKLDFSSNDLPLAPYQSSSERRISQLESNYQNSLTFEIIADPDASGGLKKVPLNITYNDENGNSYTIEDILAISVGETPKLKVYVKKSTVHQDKAGGKITLEIANAGSTDIKYLEMNLLPSEDYKLVSTTDYYYLGDVDSDDTESEEIDIYINRNKVDKLTMPIMLKYKDANGKPYQQQFDIDMQLYSSSELKKFGLVESGSSWFYILIIILAGGGYYYYRRRKKKNEKDKTKK